MVHRKKRILVIDDDNVHIYSTKALLESELLEVITHRSGSSIARIFWERQPYLVLLDVNMRRCPARIWLS